MASTSKPIPRRKFDKTFKEEALKMITEGRAIADVSTSLNVSEQLLHTWRHTHKK
jgi:transposase-like protein